MNDEAFAPFGEGPSACPFVAFDDDRDRRSDRPDYRHRCFASPQPEPRAFPHQERYCLAAGFTECPIFLEWARRESASVVSGRRSTQAPAGAAPAGAVAGGAAAAAVADAGSGGFEEPELPPFLAVRGRAPAPAEDYEPPANERAPSPEEGLWGAQAEPRRRPAGPVTATAHPNSSYPDWERPRRQEHYPRIRERRVGGVSPVLLGLIVIAAMLAAVVLVPSLLNSGGGGGGPDSSPTSAAHGSPSASPAPPTPSPSPTSQYIIYRVKANDSLSKIATLYGVSIADIMAVNPTITDPNVIAEGQVINIPRGAVEASPTPPKSPGKSAGVP